MAADNAPRSNGHRLDPAGSPFPRFESRRAGAAAWLPVDLGGHEIISRLHMKMRPGAQAAGEGRHALDRLDGTVARDQLETLRLLVTELITNAVRHAGTDSWIQLDIDIYANAVRVQVVDRGPGFHPPETPHPHRDRPGGWGLCLVDRLADRWGVALDELTCVWFELERDGSTGFAAA